jgi:hypothetical protein
MKLVIINQFPVTAPGFGPEIFLFMVVFVLWLITSIERSPIRLSIFILIKFSASRGAARFRK